MLRFAALPLRLHQSHKHYNENLRNNKPENTNDDYTKHTDNVHKKDTNIRDRQMQDGRRTYETETHT